VNVSLPGVNVRFVDEAGSMRRIISNDANLRIWSIAVDQALISLRLPLGVKQTFGHETV
jgi:hypothetical protein